MVGSSKTVALGNLRNASGLDDRRTALALGKTSGLVLVGIDAAEGFTIRVVHGNQEVMVLGGGGLCRTAIFRRERIFWEIS